MSSCALTQNFNLDCRDSYGGVKTIHIIEFDNATPAITAGVTTGITKLTGKKFWKYNLIAHTAEGDETMTSSRENGTSSVKQSVKFPLNKLAVAVRNELLLIAKNRVLIVVEDENGVGWLYGKDYGLMTSSINAKTGKALADRNGYELTFEGEEKEFAVQVDATTLAALETVGV
jgi:hypothetical protein